MEVGSIIPFAGSTVPENYLVCDGSAVSRTDYSDLFEVLGVTYGAGDGATTFNLPNIAGKVPIGCSISHSIGTSGGEEEHSIVSSELASHVHEVPQHGHGNTIGFSMPSLSHTITQPTFSYTRLNGTGAKFYGSVSNGLYSSRTAAAMTRSANLAIANHPASDCTVTGGVSDCPALDTDAVGSGQAHNNMMPYLALVYIIQAIPDTPPVQRMLIYNGCMPVTPSGCYLVGTKR